MKKLILVILLFIGTLDAYSRTFKIISSNLNKQETVRENCVITYNKYNKNIEISNYQNVTTYGPVKLDRKYSEQGLIIEEYIPINLNTSGVNKIYKFAFDENSMKPVLVVEISFRSKSDYYQIKKFYTELYFELGRNR